MNRTSEICGTTTEDPIFVSQDSKERKKMELKKCKNIRAKNFPSLVKDADLQIQDAEQTPNSINTKKCMPRHIIIKLLMNKDKKEILKAAKQKQHITQREYQFE